MVRRSPEWVLGPRAVYELNGDVPGVVFPCVWVHDLPRGLVHDAATDELRLYYGAADTCVAMAHASLRDLLDFVMTGG